MKFIFTNVTHAHGLKEYEGKQMEILRPSNSEECDAEVQPMFQAETENGGGFLFSETKSETKTETSLTRRTLTCLPARLLT